MSVILAVVNPKGGAGKTTCAAYAAHALAELGARVLGVDADPQGSLMRWQVRAEWPIPVVGMASERLHSTLPGVVGDQFDAVVIDTPGTDHGKPITLSAVRAATHVLVPIKPAPAEYELVDSIARLIEDATLHRPGQRPPAVGMLFVRVKAGTISARTWRSRATDDGWPVLAPWVGDHDHVTQSYGSPIVNALSTGYGDAVVELLRQGAP